MPETVRILPYYTYDDYVQWEGKWELIDGMPYAMSPAPAPKHQLIANNLGSEFRVTLKNCRHCKAYQAIDYKIAADTILQPDLVITCTDIKKKFLNFPPALVVEILSPSTAIKDRHTKFSIYESQQVKYYLIINLDTEEVEIFEIEKKEYALKEKGKNFSFSFHLNSDCSIDINFGEIWK